LAEVSIQGDPGKYGLGGEHPPYLPGKRFLSQAGLSIAVHWLNSLWIDYNLQIRAMPIIFDS
jgi:hypothetical protein